MRLALIALTLATSTIVAEDELLQHAAVVFADAVGTPAAAIPAAVLMRASAIAVVPAAVRDGTRYYGTGVMSARGARPDAWSPPAVIAFEGAIPLDLDAGAADFVIIAQTRRGLDHLLTGRLGHALSGPIAPGAIGHSSPARIEADLVAYIHLDRYFAGVTIDGWAVDDLPASNEALYGRAYSADDIVRGAGFFRLPHGARLWRDAIASYFREMS